MLVDVDDTLVEHSRSARAAVDAITGQDEWDLWQAITDEYARRVARGLLAYEGMHLARTATFFAALGRHLSLDEVHRREELRASLLRRGERVFDDALGFLRRTSAAGLRVAAVTNASGAHQRAKLLALGLAEHLDAVVVAGELGARKPDPRIFHTACERLGVSPGQTVHVGDRLGTDAIGARHAGLHGVWLARGGHRAGGAVGAPVVENLTECADLLLGEPAQAAGRPGPASLGTTESGKLNPRRCTEARQCRWGMV